MPKKFIPHYIINSKIANCLMRIEGAKEKISCLPLTISVLASLRETARLRSTHYSTMIEGNRLQPDQIETVLKHEGHFPGRERDEHEVKGYYAALNKVEKHGKAKTKITEKMIQEIHALVVGNGKTTIKPTVYRDDQNVIRDSRTNTIVYLPPESRDVPELMQEMVKWLNTSQDIPCPIIASIAHYQFVTIHPYYDGNGRTARLLTTLVLHLGDYDVKGMYSLEEYYARNLDAYYEAISVGPSHNYYMGRAEADITKWVEYFIEGMAISFEHVVQQMLESHIHGAPDQSLLLKTLEPRQRKILSLFQEFEVVTSSQIGTFFDFKPRTSAQLCQNWVKSGFLEIVDFSNKGRKYKLSKKFEDLLKKH